MDSDNLLYRIAFASLRGMNVRLAGQILARVDSEKTFFTLPAATLGAMMGFKSRLFDDDLRARELENAGRELQFITSSGIVPVYYTSEAYPQRLLLCDDAPVMLYTLGSADLNRSRFISIVGTRHATVYGIDFVNRLVADLAASLPEPPVIVSGLAFGIDIAAHRAALSAGLPTIAVLAHGLNTIYPAVHRPDAADIVRKGGALITDYRSIDAIHRGNFLARNRIVAGLCDCIVVVESALKGGALVTARLASGYSRDVFAVPGRTTDRYSLGCNHVISTGLATLITTAADLVDNMRWTTRQPEGTQATLFPELTPEEQTVIDILRQSDADFSALHARLPLPTARLLGLLVDMEFNGHLTALPGGLYRTNL